MGLWLGSGLCPFQAPAGPHGPGAAWEPCRGPATPQARAVLGGSSSPASVGRGHMTQKQRKGRLPHPQGLGLALGTPGSTHGWYQFPSPCGFLPRRYHELGLVSNRHVFLVVRQLEVQGRGPPDPASRGKSAPGSGTVWARPRGGGPFTKAPPHDLPKAAPQSPSPPGQGFNTRICGDRAFRGRCPP